MATRAFGLRNADLNSFKPISAQLRATTKPYIDEGNADKLCEDDAVKNVTSDDQLDQIYLKIGEVDNGRSAQLIPYYAKEIFSYLLHLETHTSKIRRDFLRNPIELCITPRMRHILFDWLVQVHSRLNLQAETLYLTFHLIDAFMSSGSGVNVRKNEYQLVGITSMLLASKFEETFAPSIHDFVYLTDNSYSAKQVRQAERRLLSELNFFLGHPLPIQFLRRFSRIANATQRVHELAKYLLECASCRSYTMSHLAPSALAAASYCLAAELLDPTLTDAGYAKANDNCMWTDYLCVYSGYMRHDLHGVIAALAAVVLEDLADVKLTAVRRKYARTNHLMISTLPQLNEQNSRLHTYAKQSNGSSASA